MPGIITVEDAWYSFQDATQQSARAAPRGLATWAASSDEASLHSSVVCDELKCVSRQVVNRVQETQQVVNRVQEAQQVVNRVQEAQQVVNRVQETQQVVNRVQEAQQVVNRVQETQQVVNRVQETQQVVNRVQETQQVVNRVQEAQQVVNRVQETQQGLTGSKRRNRWSTGSKRRNRWSTGSKRRNRWSTGSKRRNRWSTGSKRRNREGQVRMPPTPPPGTYYKVNMETTGVREHGPPVSESHLEASVIVVPAIKKAVPAIKKVVPAIKKVVPAIKKVVPAIKKAVPAIKKVVPAIKKVVPAIKKVVPATRKVVPAIKKVVPATRKVVPAIKKAVPAIKKVVPATRKVVPAIKKVVPATRKVVPAIKKGYIPCYSKYDAEDLIKTLQSRQVSPATSATSGQSVDDGLSEEVKYRLEEQKSKVDVLGTQYQELLDQLTSYESQLCEWQNNHKQLVSQLEELLRQNTDAVKLLSKEQSSVQGLRKQVDGRMKQRQAVIESLSVINTKREALRAIENTQGYKSEADNFMGRCQQLFPDINAVFSVIKVQEATKKALEMVATETGASEITSLPQENLTITEKVTRLSFLAKIKRTNCLSCGELRPLSGPMKTLLEAGWVMAFQQDHGRLRFSRMTIEEGGQLHLHVLQQQPAPAQVITLQHSAVASLVDPVSTLVFLDLAWSGVTKGRVYIRLSPENGLARQFLMLCTGERGPSYVGTRMIEVHNKGKSGERVCGGAHDDSVVGVVRLLPGVQVGPEYRRAPTVGTVRAEYGPGSEKSAQFCIFLREADWKISFAFGQVESGLKVVKQASRCADIKDVTVVNCGVVLPL
nr:uncharacterized protein LOC128704060 [Cherax quadricarinatus]